MMERDVFIPARKVQEKQVVCLYVEDQPNVLARIAAMIGRRNFNISTITASETDKPGITRITMVVYENDDNKLRQIVAQAEKLEPVIRAYVLDMTNSLYRELLLMKVKADTTNRAAIREIVDIYRAKIIDLSEESMIIELTGSPDKIDAFMRMMNSYELIEVCRTGITGVERGSSNLDS